LSAKTPERAEFELDDKEEFTDDDDDDDEEIEDSDLEDDIIEDSENYSDSNENVTTSGGDSKSDLSIEDGGNEKNEEEQKETAVIGNSGLKKLVAENVQVSLV